MGSGSGGQGAGSEGMVQGQESGGRQEQGNVCGQEQGQGKGSRGGHVVKGGHGVCLVDGSVGGVVRDGGRVDHVGKGQGVPQGVQLVLVALQLERVLYHQMCLEALH